MGPASNMCHIDISTNRVVPSFEHFFDYSQSPAVSFNFSQLVLAASYSITITLLLIITHILFAFCNTDVIQSVLKNYQNSSLVLTSLVLALLFGLWEMTRSKYGLWTMFQTDQN